jgi:hypothetical protein
MFRKAVPLRASVVAVLPDDCTAEEQLEALLQHVLFMHQQIPCVYPELKREVSELAGRQRAPMGGVQRKASKLIGALEPLLEQLAPALSAAAAAFDHGTSSPKHGGSDRARAVAAIVFGSSVAAPRLVYLLGVGAEGGAEERDAAEGSFSSLAAASTDPSGAPPQPPIRPSTNPKPGGGIRRMLRAVAIQAADIAAIDPGACRVHVLVRARREAALPAGHFRPRPGLLLKLSRAQLATVATCSRGREEEMGVDASEEGLPPAWLRGLVVGFVPPPPPTRRRPPLGGRRGGEEGGDGGAQQETEAMEGAEEEAEEAEASVGGASEPLAMMVEPMGQVSPQETAAAAVVTQMADASAAEDLADDDDDDGLIWWQSTAVLRGFRISPGR